jgi:hypothetical protein
MYATTGYRQSETSQPVIVTDKRGQRLKASQREGDCFPISELGSKAIYQVYAERFTAVTPYK